MRAVAICLAIILGTNFAFAGEEKSPLDQYLYGKEKHESSARLDVSGPQLLDYTEARDSTGHSELLGVILYIGLGWVLCPVLFSMLAMRPGTRPIGIILLALWFIFFFIPRFLEFFALFFVLPGMIGVGILKGIIRQFK